MLHPVGKRMGRIGALGKIGCTIACLLTSTAADRCVVVAAGGHRVPSCVSNTYTVEAVAVASSMTQAVNYCEDLPEADQVRRLAGFRGELYRCLTARSE